MCGIKDISRIPGKNPVYFYHFVFPRKPINVIYPCKLLFGLDFRGGKEKKIQIFLKKSDFFLFSSHPKQTPGLRTHSLEVFLGEKKNVSYTGKWNSWEMDVWKQKIPVISSGQAPVSHQGSGQYKWSWQKISPSCPISQEPKGPRKYLFPKSVNDRLQRSL